MALGKGARGCALAWDSRGVCGGMCASLWKTAHLISGHHISAGRLLQHEVVPVTERCNNSFPLCHFTSVWPLEISPC
jgi:hypothetical protein